MQSSKTVTVIPAKVQQFSTSPNSVSIKKRVAGYARVSTDNDEQLTSYEAQVDHYTASLAGYFEDFTKERGIEMTLVDGQNDATKQINQIENFIQQDMDAIIFNPISADGCAPAVDAAVEAGVPIIIAQTTVNNMDKAITYVGSDHYANGKLEIEEMIKVCGDKLNIVILQGVMGIDAQILRDQAYDDVLKNYPDIKIIERSNADWNRADAMALIENWIQAGDEFDVVLSQNDNMALGAIEALRGNNLLDKVKVFGIDGDADALVSVQQGELGGTVFYSATEIVTKSLDAAVAAVNGETVEKKILVPLIWITKDNVAE